MYVERRGNLACTSSLSWYHRSKTVAKLTGKVKRRLQAVDDRREAKVASAQEFEAISRATQLLKDGYQDLAILAMFQAIEAALNKILLEAGQPTEPFRFQNNLRKARSLELIREQDLPVIELLQNIRNQVAHGQVPLSHAELETLLQQGKQLLSFLSRPIMVTSISSFNWLMRNYEEGLNILRHGDKADVDKVLNRLMDAWKNKDGAIGLEISVFFSQALLTQTDAIITLFQNRKQELASFLDRIPYDLFTDYVGGRKVQLFQLRDDLIQRLNAYENQTKDEENKRIAQRIRKTVEETSVREIF